MSLTKTVPRYLTDNLFPVFAPCGFVHCIKVMTASGGHIHFEHLLIIISDGTSSLSLIKLSVNKLHFGKCSHQVMSRKKSVQQFSATRKPDFTSSPFNQC